MNLRREVVNILYQYYNINVTSGELEKILYDYKQVIRQENMAILMDVYNNIADSRFNLARFIKFQNANKNATD